MNEQEIVDRTLARVLKAFDEWRVKLPTDRGFNHHEGEAFVKSITAIGWADFCAVEPVIVSGNQASQAERAE